MNKLFIDELMSSFPDDIQITSGDQELIQYMFAANNDTDSFPMICYEHTDDSDFEVSIDETKFLNDSAHDGSWVVGCDDCMNVMFIMNLQSKDETLEIDVFEVNKNMRGNGIASNVLSVVESVAENYYDKISVSPFDTSAINFWEYMGYEKDNHYNWTKELDEY